MLRNKRIFRVIFPEKLNDRIEIYKVDQVDRFTRKQTRIRSATVIGRAARMRTNMSNVCHTVCTVNRLILLAFFILYSYGRSISRVRNIERAFYPPWKIFPAGKEKECEILMGKNEGNASTNVSTDSTSRSYSAKPLR